MTHGIESAEYGAHISDTNSLQLELIKRRVEGQADQSALVMEWVDKYSKRFHEILEQKATEDTEFWEKLKDPDFYRALLTDIEAELYRETGDLRIAA